MARKGTVVERVLAGAVGFFAYGVAYLVLYSVFGGDNLPQGWLGLIWLGSVAVGLLGSLVAALTILKYRK